MAESDFMQQTRNPFVRLFAPENFEGTAATKKFNLEAEVARGKMRLDARTKELEYQGKVRDSINQAFESLGHPEDKPLLDATLDSIFKSVEQTSGKKVNPLVARFFKANPAEAKEIMDAVAESGITMGDLFSMTGDPMLTAAGLTAFGKNRRSRKAAEAAGAPDQPSPSGGEIRAPAVEGGLPSTVGIDRRLTALRARRAEVLGNESNPQRITALTKGIDEEIKVLEEQRGKITVEAPLEVAKEGRQPIAQAEVDDARREALRAGMSEAMSSRMFYVGQPRAQYNDRRSLLGPQQPAAPTPVAAPQPAAAAATPGVPGLLPEQRTEEAAQRDQQRNLKLVEARSREQVNEAVLKKWEEGADSRRKMRNIRDTMESLLSELGPTGDIIGPVRVGFNNVAQLVGIEGPTKLNQLQLMDRLNKNLATESLRDFSGPDSDRDVLRAIELNPGIRNTVTANRVLLAIAKAEDTYQQDRVLNARRWVSQFGSLSNSDPATKKTFAEAWQGHLNSRPSVGRDAAERMGLKLPTKRTR